MTRSTRMMSPLDVARAHSRTVTVLGPLDLPSGPELQDRLHRFVVAGFGQRMSAVPSPTSMRWARQAEPPAVPLLRYPAVRRDGVDDVLTQFARDTVEFAGGAAIGVAGEYLLLSLNHGWGDGHLAVRVNQVMAAPGDFASAVRERRAPLLTALARFFGARPAAALQVLRTRQSGSAGDDPAGVDSGRQRPWTPSPRIVTASAPLSVVDDVRRWRDARGTGVSVSSVFFAATLRELHRQGIAVDCHVRTLFDCRRYLRGIDDPIQVGSNFVAGVDLVLDCVPSPEEVSNAIRITAATGRPLLSLTMSAVRTALATSPFGDPAAADPAMVDDEPIARLTVSDVGRVRYPESIWTGGTAERIFNSYSEPDGPTGLLVNYFQTAGGVQIGITFHDNVFDRDRLKAVADAVAHSPVPGQTSRVPM